MEMYCDRGFPPRSFFLCFGTQIVAEGPARGHAEWSKEGICVLCDLGWTRDL